MTVQHVTGPILVNGRPSEAEIAALAAAVAALFGATAGAPSPQPAFQGWRSHRRRLGLPDAPGPGAWRASGMHQ